MENQFKKLPKAFKIKWITALRSGKFKQTSDYLKAAIRWDDNDKPSAYGHCCLGVACEVSGYHSIRSSYIGNDKKRIPIQLRGEKELTKKLASMNDGGGGKPKKSFKQIANWIEKNL